MQPTSFITSHELDTALRQLWQEEERKKYDKQDISPQTLEHARLYLELFLRQFSYRTDIAWMVISSNAKDAIRLHSWFGLDELEQQLPTPKPAQPQNIIKFKIALGKKRFSLAS